MKTRPLMLIYMFIGIIFVVFIVVFDYIKNEYGEWDHCKKIKLGQTKFFIDIKYDTYRHTHGDWYMDSPCEKKMVYYLDYKRTPILLRLDTLKIVRLFDENNIHDQQSIVNIASKYNGKIDTTIFKYAKDTTQNITYVNKKIFIRYTHRVDKKDVLTISISR